jgi:hypothetical protein
MDFIRLPPSDSPPTFVERCLNAYYAFRMRTKPDIQAVIDRIDAIQAESQAAAEAQELALEDKIAAALVTFGGYEKAMVDSVAGATSNWRELFEHIMLYVDGLPAKDQVAVMQHIFRGNRNVVTEPRFRQWMSNHAEAILDHLKD